MTNPEPSDPAAAVEAARAAIEADPDLAAEVRSVLAHLASTPIDPTGAPE